MYKPKSPLASNKSLNFPPDRRKVTPIKKQPQEISLKSKPKTPRTHNINEEKKILGLRNNNFKNLQIQANDLIESLKINECLNNNETPKFCLQPKISKISVKEGLNYFSFGEKQFIGEKHRLGRQFGEKERSKFGEKQLIGEKQAKFDRNEEKQKMKEDRVKSDKVKIYQQKPKIIYQQKPKIKDRLTHLEGTLKIKKSEETFFR